jgi:HEAT repeat protein
MNRWVKVLTASLVIVLCFGLVGKVSSASTETALLKALIVNGQNNHGWKTSSPILKQILEQTGLFKVDFATSPTKGGNMENFKPNFAACDVVVLDYNGDSWSEQTKAAFVEYVKSGGGVVVYHAASNAFPNWREFNEITGLGGWSGRDEKSGPYIYWKDGKIVRDISPGSGGGHGSQHAFQVINRNREHPITKGLPEKWMHAKDELYAKLRGPAKNLTVLATAYSDPEQGGTGRHEPILFTVDYGKGRVFHTVLGHVGGAADSLPPMECVGFIVTFQRGAEWAATGKVIRKVPAGFPTASQAHTWKGYKPPSLDEVLAKIATYDYGQSREPLTELSDIVRSAYDSPDDLKRIEKRLLELLRSDATLACKQFICRKLSIIGTEEAVPALSEMLTDPKTSDMARYALERIPGSAVDKVLRDALGITSGRVKVGIISSLGERGDKKAVRELGKLLSDTDKEIVLAAISALGKIGGGKAARELRKAGPTVGTELHLPWADAYLMCADKFLAGGNTRRAMQIYRRMYATDEPVSIRAAALRGIITAEPESAVEGVVDVLKGDDSQMQAVVIGLLGEIAGTEMIKAVTTEMPNLSVAGQVQVLLALAGRGDRSALPTVLQATKSTDADVRVAAFGALGILGDASSVDLLAQTAATATDAESKAARESLYRLRGPKADEKILASIPQAAPKVKVELIRSVGERNIVTGVGTLLKTAQAPQAPVRLESFKVLKVVAEQKHLLALIKLLINVQDEAERKEAERCVAAVARKIGDEGRRAEAVLDVLPSVRDVGSRCSLLSVLGKIGDDNALPVLRAALKDEDVKVRDTAIRALADWPNPELIDDLREVARSSDNELHRVLALRGFVRLIGLDSARPAEETNKMYIEAMALAPNVNEKKMVLSGLANAKTFGALQLASAYLKNKALQQEAEVAVVKIAEATYGSHPDLTKDVLQEVIRISKDDSLRQQAHKLIEQIRQFEDYITTWQVSGPYTKEGATPRELFDVVFQPETNPEKAKWQIMPTGTDKGKPWLLELDKAIGGDDRVAYLRTNVRSKSQKVRLELGSNDGIKVWLNGKVVHANNTSRTITPGEDIVEVTLRKGWNTLMMKITQSGGTWSACARLCALDGDSLTGLKVVEDVMPKVKARVKLVGNDFSTWREPGDWQIVGQAIMNPENEKLFATKPGRGIIVNGPKGRTVDLLSRAEFADVRAHIEFMVPRGSNSGVYFMGRYEIQILDSWGVKQPKFSDCGGIYQRWDDNRTPKGYEGHPPRVNASLPPGQWQSFDIIFRAPRFDSSGKKIANACFEKVIHNGIMVHSNVEVTGPTRADPYRDEKPTGPLMLQGDHGPVAYRNVWIVPLKRRQP